MDGDVSVTNQSSRALERHPLHAQRAEGGDGGSGRPSDHAQYVRERAEKNTWVSTWTSERLVETDKTLTKLRPHIAQVV